MNPWKAITKVAKVTGKVVAAPVVYPVKAVAHGVEVVTMKIALGVVRHVLTAAGGGLVANGLISSADLELAVGAILTLVGIAASVYEKRKATV